MPFLQRFFFSFCCRFSALVMIWMTTGRWTYVVIGLDVFVLATLAASHVLGQVNERISDWLDPWARATGTGYQPVQGELAFARGGLFGTGIGFGIAARTLRAAPETMCSIGCTGWA